MTAFDKLKYANGDARKPVQYRCGPATVTGTASRTADLRSRRHWATGKASEGPKPGDLSVRATMHTLGGGLVACRRPVAVRIARPPPSGTGDFYFRPWSPPPRLRAARSALLALSACRPAAPATRSGGIVDDAGDTVAVAGPPHRIVSLIPATTELLFAIGAGSSVVGRTEWCDYPPAAAAVPNLGDGIAPNVEAILASRPDLVLLYNSAQNAAIAARLRALGIPALRLNTDRLADVDRIGRLLGRVTGHAAAADSVAAVFDTALASATVTPAGPRPKVLLLVWEQPPMTIGRGSFLDELVRAGRRGQPVRGRGVECRDREHRGGRVARSRPDPHHHRRPGRRSPAGPSGRPCARCGERRFLPVTGSEFNRPSPRAPAAIRELGARLRRRRVMRGPDRACCCSPCSLTARARARGGHGAARAGGGVGRSLARRRELGASSSATCARRACCWPSASAEAWRSAAPRCRP